MNRNPIVMAVAFAFGGMVMIGIRGAGTSTAQGTAAGEGGAHDEHAGHEEQAGHEAGSDEQTHAGHSGAGAHKGHAAPDVGGAAAEHTGHAKGAESDTVEMWVCESDETTGKSWEGECPLDGTPLVKKAVPVSKITDLGNETCPVMGGTTKDDVFAVYKGEKVRFCCPGCDKKFFAAPEQHISKLKKASN